MGVLEFFHAIGVPLAELWGRNGSQDPPPLQPGDLVTLTVEGIGCISAIKQGARTFVETELKGE